MMNTGVIKMAGEWIVVQGEMKQGKPIFYRAGMLPILGQPVADKAVYSFNNQEEVYWQNVFRYGVVYWNWNFTTGKPTYWMLEGQDRRVLIDENCSNQGKELFGQMVGNTWLPRYRALNTLERFIANAPNGFSATEKPVIAFLLSISSLGQIGSSEQCYYCLNTTLDEIKGATGLSKDTVKLHIKSLKRKKIIINHKYKKSEANEDLYSRFYALDLPYLYIDAMLKNVYNDSFVNR